MESAFEKRRHLIYIKYVHVQEISSNKNLILTTNLNRTPINKSLLSSGSQNANHGLFGGTRAHPCRSKRLIHVFQFEPSVLFQM